jgi:hypothetical protein
MVHTSFFFSFDGAICLDLLHQHDYLDDQVTRLHKIYLLPGREKERVGC